LLSIFIGSKFAIQPKEDWKEYPTFWTALIAPPSSKKSVVMKQLYGSIKNINNTGDEQILIDLGTSEYIWKILSSRQKDKGCVWLLPELASLFDGIGKYNKKDDTISILLEGWSNPYHQKIGRINNKNTIKFNGQTLSICGAIQSRYYQKYFDLEDKNGFLSRWLFAFPQPHKNQNVYEKRSFIIDKHILNLIERIENIKGYSLVKFDKETIDLWAVLWENLQEEIILNESLNPVYAQYLGKMQSQILRFALIIHLLSENNQSNYCSIESLQKAFNIGCFYLCHFIKLISNDKKTILPLEDVSTKTINEIRNNPNISHSTIEKELSFSNFGKLKRIFQFLR